MTEIIDMAEWETRRVGRGPGMPTEIPHEARDAFEALRRQGRLEVVELREGLKISTRSFVGTVALGDATIQIAPKVSPQHMPAFMRYALGMDHIQFDDAASTPIESGGFLDILARVLLQEVDDLARAGLAQDYQQVQEWTGSPRGSIQFSPLARNPVRAVTALPCRFSRRLTDIPLNRLTLACLGSLRPVVSDFMLAFDLHAREAMFGELCKAEPLSRDLLRCAADTLDRRTSYYQPIVNLASFILAGLGVGFSGEQETNLSGFLFDMNVLFENFVARLCKEYAPATCTIDKQETNSDAYRMTSSPHGWKQPRLRPDIVVRDSSGEPTMIIDTKYKRFGPMLRPGPADIYQLTLYSVGFATTAPVPARIIYPSETSSTNETSMTFQSFNDRRSLANVRIMPLDIERCARALQAGDTADLKAIVAQLIAD